MHENPTVSIVMPTYNSEKYVAEAINSVINQTFECWELLVCDDASIDGTIKIVEKFVYSDPRIKLFTLDKNSGAATARNLSMKQASGRFIAFLDSDDIWKPEKLQLQISVMKKQLAVLSFGAYEVHGKSREEVNRYVDVKAPNRITYNDLLKKRASFGCLTVVFDRTYFSDYAMPDIRRGQDYALWLKLLRNCEHAVKVDSIIGIYRLTPGSISSNKFRKAIGQWRIYRDIERLSVHYSAWCFIHYAWQAVVSRSKL